MSGKVRTRLGDLLLKISFCESQGLIKVYFKKRPPWYAATSCMLCMSLGLVSQGTVCEDPSRTRCCRSPCLWSSSLDPATFHHLSAHTQASGHRIVSGC